MAVKYDQDAKAKAIWLVRECASPVAVISACRATDQLPKIN